MTLLVNWLLEQGAEPITSGVLFLPNLFVPGNIFAYNLPLATCTVGWWNGYVWTIECPATAVRSCGGNVCFGDADIVLAWTLSEASLLFTWHF